MVIGRRQSQTPEEIAIKPFYNCFVERDEAAFSKLRLANHETIGGDIVQLQSECLRDTQTSCREKSEQGGECVRSYGARGAKSQCLLDESADFHLREDKWDGPSSV